MYKKTITYVDYDGTERTEDFYFNFNRAEIARMEADTPGGLKAKIERIVNAKNYSEIYHMWEDLILRAYGEKTPDGRRFVKIDNEGVPVSKKFRETEAFSEFMSIIGSDANEAAAFINGIVPTVPAAAADVVVTPATIASVQ